MSIISGQQLAAFHATEYYVEVPDGSFILRIGEHSLALRQLHEVYAVASSAYLTAWNPVGELTPPDRNAETQAALERDLDDLGVVAMPGVGRDPTSDWAEQSVLAIGLSREQAIALGNRYQQLAILFNEHDAIPELVLLR